MTELGQNVVKKQNKNKKTTTKEKCILFEKQVKKNKTKKKTAKLPHV